MEIGESLLQGKSDAVDSLVLLRDFGKYSEIAVVLNVIALSDTREQRLHLLRNKALWEELSILIRPPTPDDVRTCVAWVIYCTYQAGKATMPEPESAYVNLALCLPYIFDLVQIITPESEPIERRRFLLGLVNRSTTPIISLAMSPGFPSFFACFPIALQYKEQGPKDFYGRLAMILSNLSTVEEVAPILREHGAIDYAEPLLTNPIPVMRVCGKNLKSILPVHGLNKLTCIVIFGNSP